MSLPYHLAHAAKRGEIWGEVVSNYSGHPLCQFLLLSRPCAGFCEILNQQLLGHCFESSAQLAQTVALQQEDSGEDRMRTSGEAAEERGRGCQTEGRAASTI